MKTLNSKKYFSILVCALSICAACAGYAETVTLWADSPVLNLNTNDVAQCIYLRLPYSGFQSGLPIQSSNHSCVSCQFTTTNQNDRPVVVGPRRSHSVQQHRECSAPFRSHGQETASPQATLLLYRMTAELPCKSFSNRAQTWSRGLRRYPAVTARRRTRDFFDLGRPDEPRGRRLFN